MTYLEPSSSSRGRQLASPGRDLQSDPPPHSGADGLADIADLCPGVVLELVDAGGDGADCEPIRAYAAFHFFPEQWCRDRGPWPRARRIGAYRRGAATVAQVINIDPAMPRPLGHVGGEQLRRLRNKAIRHPFCESLDLVPPEL